MIITVIGVIAVAIAALWLYRPPTTTERTEHRVSSEIVPVDAPGFTGSPVTPEVFHGAYETYDGEIPTNGMLFIPEGLHVPGRHEATPENSEYHAERLIERFTEQLDTERVLRAWMERNFREPTAELIDYGMGGRR